MSRILGLQAFEVAAVGLGNGFDSSTCSEAQCGNCSSYSFEQCTLLL